MNSPQMPLEQDLATTALQGRRVAVVGYGNQGRAHALNLRDSGIDVVVTGRAGSDARARAATEGLATADVPQAVEGAALVVVALPDEVHRAAWGDVLAPCVRAGQTVGFIHGSSVHFGMVRPAAGIGVVITPITRKCRSQIHPAKASLAGFRLPTSPTRHLRMLNRV